MAFPVPLVPFLPLVAAHPPEHERNALLIGQIDNMFTGYLRFPPEEVNTKVFYITQYVRLTLRVVTIKKVGGIVAPTHQKITTIDLQIKIAALHLGKLFVVIAMLRDAPDTETNMGTI